jgi:hypothetical protein
MTAVTVPALESTVGLALKILALALPLEVAMTKRES